MLIPAKPFQRVFEGAVPTVADFNTLKTELATLSESLKKSKAASPTFGLPSARIGENALTSRPYYFQKAAGFARGNLQEENCKVEIMVSEKLKKAVPHLAKPKEIMAPFDIDSICSEEDGDIQESFRAELKALVSGSVQNFDRDEARHILMKGFGYTKKTAESWLDSSLGGATVGPETFGQLVPLFRNKSALMNAGATMVPLGPSGRSRWPRQTGVATAYNVGEAAAITGTTVATGNLILTARKIGCLVTMNDELLRFANPLAELMVRTDMMKSVSLLADYNGLFGTGTDTQCLGLANTPNISKLTTSNSTITNAGNVNTVYAQTVYDFISLVEQANAEFEGWILNPKMFWKMIQIRAAVSTDKQGFLFSLWRELSDGFKKIIAGFPVVTTNQVPLTRPNDAGTTGTNTCIFGGMWSNVLFGTFGVINFAEATQGDTAFANDQTNVRAILHYDVGVRNPGAISFVDNVTQTLGA